jgi:hypothetical protein
MTGRWAPLGTARWTSAGTSSVRSQKESAELRQKVPCGLRRETAKIQVGAHLSVRKAEDPARELDQEALVP